MLNGDLATDCQTFVEWHEHQLGRDLPTWQSRMEAIAAGDIDPKSGDAETLLLGCADIADEALNGERPRLEAEAKAEGKLDMTPAWKSIAVMYLRSMSAGGYTDGGKAIGETLCQMGEVADEWLAEKAIA